MQIHQTLFAYIIYYQIDVLRPNLIITLNYIIRIIQSTIQFNWFLSELFLHLYFLECSTYTP